MRDLEGIRNAHFDQRLRSNALDMLIELKRCSEVLPEDSPRGISAKALVDKVWGDMPRDTVSIANPAPPPIYQPQGRFIPLSAVIDGRGNLRAGSDLAEVAGQGEVCVPKNTEGAEVFDECSDPRTFRVE